MRISGRCYFDLNEVKKRIFKHPDWDENKNEIADKDFSSSAFVQVEERQIKIWTAWSGFEYVFSEYGDHCQFYYNGALNGFLQQNLFPSIKITEMYNLEYSGEYVSCSEEFPLDIFKHLRDVVHTEISKKITPLKLGEVKPSQDIKKRLGLVYATYGGWINECVSRGGILSGWFTPSIKKKLDNLLIEELSDFSRGPAVEKLTSNFQKIKEIKEDEGLLGFSVDHKQEYGGRRKRVGK